MLVQFQALLVRGFKAPTLLASEKEEFPRELTHWILINEDNTTTVRIARSLGKEHSLV